MRKNKLKGKIYVLDFCQMADEQMKKCNPLALVVQIGCTISVDGLHRFESQLFPIR